MQFISARWVICAVNSEESSPHKITWVRTASLLLGFAEREGEVV